MNNTDLSDTISNYYVLHSNIVKRCHRISNLRLPLDNALAGILFTLTIVYLSVLHVDTINTGYYIGLASITLVVLLRTVYYNINYWVDIRKELYDADNYLNKCIQNYTKTCSRIELTAKSKSSDVVIAIDGSLSAIRKQLKNLKDDLDYQHDQVLF